jgi:hypothetical protein
MPRTQADIEAEIASVRAAMRAMESTAEGSVGLDNAHDFGGRVEQGMRPSYDALARRLKDLEAELAAFIAHPRVLRSRFSKGL